MEEKVRKELWTMTVLSLGGPLASKDSIKGKAVDRTEESKLAMVEVLEELMRAEPTEEEEASNWTAFDELPVQAKKDTAPPRSILFHTLTTLLGLAADPTSLVQLQLSSIASLRTLTLHYLAPTLDPDSRPSPLLATALPGMASTLSRIALSKPPNSKASLAAPNRKQTSSVVVQALDLLSTLVTLSVSDIVTRGLRRNGTIDSTSIVALEQLADQEHESSLQSVSEPGPPESNDPPSPPVTEGMTIPTPAWLRFTITSLSTLFVALSPLTSHHSPSVRTAFVHLLSNVVQRCSATFDIHLETPIEGLLILSSDSWDEVCDPARRTLANLLDTPSSPPPDQAIPSLISFANIVQRRLASLPLALRKHDEDGIRRSANVIQSALDALPVAQPLESLLANMSRWSWNVTAAVELERIMGTSEGAGMGMSLAWIDGGRHETKEASQSFPRIRLRNVHEDATIDSLEKLWFAFGAAAAKSKKEDALIDHFLGIVLGPRRGESAAVSSLWILDGVMRGIQSVSTDKRRKKVLKGVIKAVIALLGELEGNEEKVESTLDEQEDPQPQNLDSNSLLNQVDGIPLIKHTKGVTSIPSLDDYKPVVAKSTPALDRASHHILLLSLSLRLLGTLSCGLSSSFQPFLLPSLYHVLASTSATAHPFLRLYAQITLAIVAESTSFTSPQELVLANVDYIVNSVSQRLSVSRLDTSAPLVLVEMIRLVGQPIIPIVQDLVDDVFEALDDFHGYQEVTVGLWAVLDALLKVMEEDLPSNVDPSKGRSVSIESTFDSFKTWFVSRKEKEEEPDEETVSPQQPFKSSKDANEKEEPTEFLESQEVAPTRSQAVTSQILSKSLYFLSHPSSFLRARVLSLLASAVPLLAQPSLDSKSPQNRSADLLPIIHRAWPFILNRLADSELSVVCEAATLIESLACHVGDFMSRRILEDVWPRFRTLLAQQEVNDLDSALAGSTRYSTSHRLYGSILRTLVKVAQNTPLKEDVVWEQGVLLRRFLASSIDSELRNHAFKLYELLGKVNRDVVWLVLAGSLGTVEGLPKFLEMSTVNFDGSVEDLLERM